MDAYTGEIRIFAGTFAPANWALCNGQLLPISSNTALYSILGTNFGGNGTSTFGLPNLQGNAPIGVGQGPGLSSYTVGQAGGATSFTLNQTTMPSHTHALTGTSVTNNSDTPVNAYPGSYSAGRQSEARYAPGTAATTGVMDINSITLAGATSPTPVSTVQPYLEFNFIICLYGIFPTRG